MHIVWIFCNKHVSSYTTYNSFSFLVFVAMLSWILHKDQVTAAMITSDKIELSLLPDISNLSHKLLDENVNIQRVKKYFSSDAWNCLKGLIATKRDGCDYSCFICSKSLSDQDSLACDGCLEWQHLKCAGLKNVPKKSYWMCKNCMK